MGRDLDLTKVDVKDLLKVLKVENLSDNEVEANFSCPFPGHAHGDDRPSAFMNLETTAWFCHGCKRRGNAVTFLAEHENFSKLYAAWELRNEYDSTFREPASGSFAQEWDDHFAATEAAQPEERVTADDRWIQEWWVDWDLAQDDADDPTIGYMFDRGFDPVTLQRWDVGFDPVRWRFTIPVRDADGTLVGYKGRAVDPENKPKYYIYGDNPKRASRFGVEYGFPSYNGGAVVFGLDRAGQRDRLVVCEGELDVIALHQAGITEAVCLGGSYLTERQSQLIRWHADEVVLFLDSLKESDEIGPRYVPDGAGVAATLHVAEALQPFMPVRIVPDHVGDPASMTPEQSRALIDAAESSMMVEFPW